VSAPVLARFVGCLLALHAAGCADDAAPSGEARVELGLGLERFAPVDDGEPIELVLGSQGGWHVDLAARVYGVDETDDIILSFRVYQGDGQIAYPIKRRVDPERAPRSEDGALEYPGARLVFAIMDPSEVVGEDCRPEVELIVSPEVYRDDRALTVVDERP